MTGARRSGPPSSPRRGGQWRALGGFVRVLARLDPAGGTVSWPSTATEIPGSRPASAPQPGIATDHPALGHRHGGLCVDPPGGAGRREVRRARAALMSDPQESPWEVVQERRGTGLLPARVALPAGGEPRRLLLDVARAARILPACRGGRRSARHGARASGHEIAAGSRPAATHPPWRLTPSRTRRPQCETGAAIPGRAIRIVPRVACSRRAAARPHRGSSRRSPTPPPGPARARRMEHALRAAGIGAPDGSARMSAHAPLESPPGRDPFSVCGIRASGGLNRARGGRVTGSRSDVMSVPCAGPAARVSAHGSPGGDGR